MKEGNPRHPPVDETSIKTLMDAFGKYDGTMKGL
jgi:hypothetical protein